MELKELFGRTITQIYGEFSMQDEWLDTADCYIELDKTIVIGFPFFAVNTVSLRDLPHSAKALLWADGRDEPAYLRKIIDFVWYDDADYGGYFLLDDGTLIYETRMAPHGTGHAGLRKFDNLQKLEQEQGSNYSRLTTSKDGCR